MSIGLDPREWIVELMGAIGFTVLIATAYVREDTMIGIAAVFILILTLYLWRLRVSLDISVRGG
ncbi:MULTISPECIES: hypothetical protein [Haloferacaceae]|uniref:Uncharacterized protein n=1 Tax=Halorubrum glutamatedens TaxID=2707018 RepID=A0ABD5QTD7_9EURY|nr:hypothetical protein [Halobellus captivus]